MNLEPSIERKIILVVPCYNEKKRWDSSYWDELSKLDCTELLFVNDGSSDGTLDLIREVSARYSYTFIDLELNRGKAEAVRLGFLRAFDAAPFGIGFLDSDAAFNSTEVKRQIASFLDKNTQGDSDVSVWSSRVQLAGRNLHRSLARHYLSRILITILSVRLNFSVYDPQSGLKLYRNSSVTRACFSEPFETRWFLDLEIYLRYRRISGKPMSVWEEPVLSWKDVAGSKIVKWEYFRILKDIFRLTI